MINDINYFPTSNSMNLPHLLLSSSPSALSSISNPNHNSTFSANTSTISKSVPIPASLFTVPARNYGLNNSGFYNNNSHNDIDNTLFTDNYNDDNNNSRSNNNNNNNNNNNGNNNNNNNNNNDNNQINYNSNNNSYALSNGGGHNDHIATGYDNNDMSNNRNESTLQTKNTNITNGCFDNSFTDYKDIKISSASTGNIVSLSSNPNIHNRDLNNVYPVTYPTPLAPIGDESIYHQTDHLTNINLNQSVLGNNTRINIESDIVSSTIEKVEMVEKGKDQRVSEEQVQEQEHIDDKDGLLALEGLLSLSKY